MDNNILRYESLEEALTLTIRLANKSLKEVAISLWPSLKVERAHPRLIECLNGSMKLTMDEIIHISHFCKRYDALHYMADECNHIRPKIKTLEEEEKEIKDMFKNMQDILQKSHGLFERMIDREEKREKIAQSTVHFMEPFAVSK